MSETLYPEAAAAILAEAFLRMELSPPASFADDSEQAQTAALIYPEALRSCLEFCDWSFASTFTQLSEAVLPAGVLPDPVLPYAFTIPGECLRLREVGDRATRWRVDGRRLRADQPGPLPVRYTAMIASEANLPARFRQAVALELAARLAPRWLGTATKIEGLNAQADGALRLAARDDRAMGSQTSWRGDQPDEWLGSIVR